MLKINFPKFSKNAAGEFQEAREERSDWVLGVDGVSGSARLRAIFDRGWEMLLGAPVFVGGLFWGDTGRADCEAPVQQQGVCESWAFGIRDARGEHEGREGSEEGSDKVGSA